ncbi:MAG: hypothetical protein HY298_13135 [Verrucomicrobia bacterium]|nr:hypothetical protein [Verrucomicrobiota bacterium]
MNSAGHTNLAFDAGAIRFWFTPYWSSASDVTRWGSANGSVLKATWMVSSLDGSPCMEQ